MIFDLLRDLDFFLSDITFSGINNIDYTIIEKINRLANKFEKIYMNNLKKLLKELEESIRVYKISNDNNIGEVVNSITKIEFYVKNALYFEK